MKEDKGLDLQPVSTARTRAHGDLFHNYCELS